MKAKLKDIVSPDVANLENFYPEESDCFGFLLQLLIGPEDEEGEESFEVEVVTPKWLAKTLKREDIVFGRHYVIVLDYDWDRIINKIRSYVEHCAGRNWEEIAYKLSLLGAWEFEDYEEYDLNPE